MVAEFGEAGKIAVQAWWQSEDNQARQLGARGARYLSEIAPNGILSDPGVPDAPLNIARKTMHYLNKRFGDTGRFKFVLDEDTPGGPWIIVADSHQGDYAMYVLSNEEGTFRGSDGYGKWQSSTLMDAGSVVKNGANRPVIGAVFIRPGVKRGGQMSVFEAQAADRYFGLGQEVEKDLENDLF